MDVALFNLNKCRLSARQIIGKLNRSYPNAEVIMVSLYIETSFIQKLNEAGIKGYLEYDSEIHEFVHTVTKLRYYTEVPKLKNEFLFSFSRCVSR